MRPSTCGLQPSARFYANGEWRERSDCDRIRWRRHPDAGQRHTDHAAMDSAALLAQYGPYAGTAIYCFLGAFIPVFNIEAFLVVLSAGTEIGRDWFPLALVTVTAHMAGKCLLYAVGRGLGSTLSAGRRAQVASAERRLQQWRFGPAAFVFTSAGLGFPPLYAVALLAGTLRLGVVRFFLPGFAGRFLRFSALLLFPQAALRLFHAL